MPTESDGSAAFLSLPILWLVVVAVVHVAFAFGVFGHASDRRTLIVSPIWWALGTLVLGPLMAIGYWIVNASTLRPDVAASGASRGPRDSTLVPTDSYECRSCNRVNTTKTPDGFCPHCGAPVNVPDA